MAPRLVLSFFVLFCLLLSVLSISLFVLLHYLFLDFRFFRLNHFRIIKIYIEEAFLACVLHIYSILYLDVLKIVLKYNPCRLNVSFIFEYLNRNCH